MKNNVLIVALRWLCILTVLTPSIGLVLGLIGAMMQNASSFSGWSGGYSRPAAVLIIACKYLLWSAPFVLITTIVMWIVARFCSDKGTLPKMGKVFVFTILAWFAVGIFTPQIDCQGVLACGFKLKQLHTALQQYAKEDPNGQYPAPEKWCDVVMEKTNLNANAFRCPRDYKGPCSYALNPGVRFDSAGDVVLLFETDPGWNQHRQQELLRVRNHRDFTRKTVNVVTNNGRVFGEEELAELKWQD